MPSGSDTSSSPTVIEAPKWLFGLFWVGFPLIGAGIGLLIKLTAGWIASIPIAPRQVPIGLLDDLVDFVGDPLATIGALVIGAVAGLIIGSIATEENLTVHVTDDKVTLLRGETTQEIERASVFAVFLDGGKLVLLGPTTEELARYAHDLNADQLSEAFINHGYPWHLDGDPYKDEFRRWVEGTPDLPANANLLLNARARALSEDDDTDLADFRTELTKLGIVVRDEKKRQFWRRVKQPSPASSEADTN